MTHLNSLRIVVVNNKGALKAQYLIIIWIGIFIAEDIKKEIGPIAFPLLNTGKNIGLLEK